MAAEVDLRAENVKQGIEEVRKNKLRKEILNAKMSLHRKQLKKEMIQIKEEILEEEETK